ncbi:MAG: hypothetical protein NTU89_04125 [Candidatus Dependentiae bacterium]|nr:hypothetical protein [Candidatus Dependentiae bacterium]
MIFSVDEIFNLLNFAFRIGLVIYVIRYYVVGKIVQQIGQEKFEINSLRQQYTMWREKSADVVKRMKEEEQDFLTMQEKFIVWDRQITLAASKRKADCATRQSKINDSAHFKLQSFGRRNLMKAELPKIIMDTTQDLQKKFKEDSSLGHEYISKILDGLQG